MTSGQFREVDFDLLADYVGGALDGTPEQVVVERLIATAPPWRDAHQALVRAMEPVQDALAGWAAADQVTMPDDVTRRLTAALDAAGPAAAPTVPAGRFSPEDADPGRTGPDSPPSDPGDDPAPAGPRRFGAAGSAGRAPGRTLGAAPRPAGRAGAGQGVGSGVGSARRRQWVRRAGPVAVAAAVVAFGVAGLTWLTPNGDGQSDSASNAGGAALPPTELPRQATDNAGGTDTTGGPRVLMNEPARRLLVSGTDYTSSGLRGEVVDLGQRAAGAEKTYEGPGDSPATGPADTGPAATGPAATGPTEQTGRAPGSTPVPAGLRRLADLTALETCLAAVTAEHGRGEISVQTVDYASFEGAPALVVVFTSPAGERWAWVAGPDCGLPGSAADTRQRARVG